MAKKLRLYVWTDVLTDYTSGIMFALASSIDEARALIQATHPGSETVETDLRAAPDIYEEPAGFAVWGGA